MVPTTQYSPAPEMMYIVEGGKARKARDMEEWVVFMGRCEENLFRRAVAKTIMWHEHIKVEVSTMFLGTNHSFNGDSSPPVLFESMAFHREGYSYGDHGDFDLMERYTTPEEAAAGHELMIWEVIEYFQARSFDPEKWDLATVEGEAHPDMWKDDQ